MRLGIFNARGINKSEHFIPLEIEELKKQGHEVRHFWIKGKWPTKEDRDWMEFAIYHFVPTALFFMKIGVPFCVLPTANDVFPDNGERLKIVEQNKNCKFIGYQSFYHKKKYNEWGITKPTVFVPHCVRVDLFKRTNPLGKKIIAGGRLIPKKGLHRISPVSNLVVFGDGPLKEQLENILDAEFVGWLEGAELKDLMEDSWLFLCPSIITPEGDSEGIPNILKEAMLMKLQVIASPVAGIPEFENITLLEDWININEVIKSMPNELNYKGYKEVYNLYNPTNCVNMLLEGINRYK